MVKNLTCRNENTNWTQTGKPVTIIWVCVSSKLFHCSRPKRRRRRRPINLAGFWAACLPFGKRSEHQWKYFCAVASKNTTEVSCERWLWSTETPKPKAQSEQQNRRKFLFILFVIISFLHYEYLRFLFLLCTSSFIQNFTFKQKRWQWRRKLL